MKQDDIIKIDEYAGQVIRVTFDSDHDFDQFIESSFWNKYADFSDDKSAFIPSNLAGRMEKWADKNDVSVSIGAEEDSGDAALRGGEEPDINFTQDELMAETKKPSAKKLTESIIAFKQQQDYVPGEGATVTLKDPLKFSIMDPEVSVAGMSDICTLNGAMSKIIEMAKQVKVQNKNNFVENMRENVDGIKAIKEMCEGLLGFNDDLSNAKSMHQHVISAAMMGEKAFENPLAEDLPYTLSAAEVLDADSGSSVSKPNADMVETFSKGMQLFVEMYNSNKHCLSESYSHDKNIAGWSLADFEEKVQKITAGVTDKSERVGPFLTKTARTLAQFQNTLASSRDPHKIARGGVVRDVYEQLQAALQIMRGISKYAKDANKDKK